MLVTTVKFEINEANPFENDKFNRKIIADNLEKIIEYTNGSLVLSIDSGWGKGKTTFIQMWKKRLENEGHYKVLYFNAWENDDTNDPLLALISEMEDVLFENNDQRPTLDKIKSCGKPLLKQALPIALKILTSGIIDISKVDFGEFYENQVTDLAGKIGEMEIVNYKKEKQGKVKFKEALEEYQREEGKKILFFVDELDRCRPTFAVETLERIKHLFNIDNFIFIIALDKQQLAYSIATLYGQKMDSNGYLKRFIDLEYSLPEPNRDFYVDFLLDRFDLRNKNTTFFEIYLKETIKVHDLSLRDMDKLFLYLKLVLPITPLFNSLEENYKPIYLKVLGVIYSLFPVIKIKYGSLYQSFINKDYDPSVFSKEIRTSLTQLKDDIDYSHIISNLISMNIRLKDINNQNNLSVLSGTYHVGNQNPDSTRNTFNLFDLLDNSRREFSFVKHLQFLDQFIV